MPDNLAKPNEAGLFAWAVIRNDGKFLFLRGRRERKSSFADVEKQGLNAEKKRSSDPKISG